MVTGRGAVHSERYERLRAEGGAIEFLQIWAALPEADEDCAPAFVHVPAAEVGVIETPGARIALLAGAAAGARARIAGDADLYLHLVDLDDGAAYAIPGEHAERALYVLDGALACDSERAESGKTLILAPGAPADVRAIGRARVLSFGGAPIGPRRQWWNFVSSRLDRIEAAKADWRAGRMPLPPTDPFGDFTPAPEDSGRPLLRLNG